MRPIQSYYSNGILEAEGFLEGNLQVGSWAYYHENGGLYTKGQFNKQGIPSGIWTEYYSNGQKKYDAISENGNCFLLSSDNLQILNYWNEEGENLIQKGEGTLTTYFDNGKVEHISTWLNNLKNGILQEFFGNGQLRIERNYKNGVKNGEGKIFHNSGNLYTQSFYQDGKPIKYYKEWYNNGQLCEEGFYKGGTYLIDNFWDETGEQSLINGNGYVIKKDGLMGLDIYKQEYENYIMIKETRL